DQTARQGFANAQFEVNAEEGLDLVEEFYMDENQETNIEQAQPLTMTRAKVKDKSNHEDGFVQDIQKGLQGSVRAIN
ncbi:hydrolase or metal-binding protein, partial [Escherichia coli]|nr:hydrolase or metal-binding protein [Escherichia coli]